MGDVYLSLVVPVYNEERRVEKGLGEMLRFLSKQDYTWELVVVDDGSEDNTLSIIKNQFSIIKNGDEQVRLIHLPENQGKGGALREGFSRKNGKYVVFSDVDLSVSIEELPKLLDGLRSFDVVIGSRRAEGAKIVKHQPWLREQMGRVFTWLVSSPLGLGVSDATCGFKGFRASIGKRLFGASRVAGWAYDAEILYLARKWGYSIKEIPVDWQNDEQTRVRLGRDVVGSLAGLVQILINDWMGRYG